MEPLSEKRYLELPAPAGGDFLAARERLLAALPDGCRLTLGCLQQLYPVLSAADYRVTVTLCPGPGGTDAVRVEPGDTTAEHYGLCLDIGSTIMQMELVDLVRGRTLSQAACTNSQTQFGANILDRILAVKADRENLKTLQALTLSDVRGMIDTCCRAADIRPEAISAMTVGGNTTMLHFFLGCDPWLVFQSPYTPVFFDPGVIRAAELGLPICGNVYCMPAIANYLGGDITGGLLETDLDTREDLALFLDIGTNGELVLGCRDFLLMGAGAAGPALEGAVSHSGQIMAVGGVTRKIEGFFKVCARHGLTGSQGVIIPHDNVDHLMLSPDVLQAVEKGQFAIYAVRSIEEALTLLTGLPVGRRRKDDTFTPGSLYDMVDRRLERLGDYAQNSFRRTRKG